jgi:hypothetical protein
MKYEDLDPILDPWAKAHGLMISTKYRDEEVRSACIVDDTGNVFSIGVWPDQDTVRIGVGDHQTKSHSFRTESTLNELAATLEETYARVDGWINESGSTRTPVQ